MDTNTTQTPSKAKKNGKAKADKPEATEAQGQAITLKRPKVGEIAVEIFSTSPMLQDAMSEDDVERILIDGDRDAKITGIPRRERAQKKLYVGPKGPGGITATVLMAALREAGRRVKVGKSALSTAKTSTVHSIIQIVSDDDFLAFDRSSLEPDTTDPNVETKYKVKDGWVPDVRRGQMANGAAKVTVGLCRPKFPRWGMTIKAKINYGAVQGVTDQQIADLFTIAGSLVGVGSFRPSCNGPFGCFAVEKYLVTKKPDRNAAVVEAPSEDEAKDDGEEEGEEN